MAHNPEISRNNLEFHIAYLAHSFVSIFINQVWMEVSISW